MLSQDTLFVGLTRPAMRWGVTYPGLLLNVVVTMELFLLSRNMLILLFSIPLHLLEVLLCSEDPRLVELIALWARTHAYNRMVNASLWSASTYGALPVQAPGRRGTPSVPTLVKVI